MKAVKVYTHYDKGYDYAFDDKIKNKSEADCPQKFNTEETELWKHGFRNGKHDRAYL